MTRFFTEKPFELIIRLGSAKLAIILFLLSFINSAVHAEVPYISLWDEMYHLSYVQYVINFQIPLPGSPMNEWSRHYFSCMPIYPNGFVTTAKCGQILPLELFPEGGRNSAAHWAPIYYAVTALIVKPLIFFGIDPLFASRIATSAIWAVGISILFLATHKIFQNIFGSISVALVVASLPAAFYHSSFVSPYSTIPLLIALQLFTFSKFFFTKTFKEFLQFFTINILVIFTLPQMIMTFIVLVLTYVIYSVIVHRKINFLNVGFQIATAIFGYELYNYWVKFQQSRAIPMPNLPSGTFTQLADNTFSLIESFKFFFWFTWPGSIYDWPFLAENEFRIGVVWVIALTISFLYIIFNFRKMQFAFSLAASIAIIAPFVGFIYDQQLPFGPPLRYVWPVGLLSLVAFAGFKDSTKVARLLLLAAGLTYVASYWSTAFSGLM